MSETELRELDAWIDTHLFDGGKFVGLKKRGLWYRPKAQGYTDDPAEAGRYTREEAKHLEYPHDEPVKMFELPIRRFTTDPAAAMLVLEKCIRSNRPHGGITFYDSRVSSVARFTVCAQAIGNLRVEAETLPLAIALFAKQCFK